MKLSEISKVEELTSHADLNEYLALGWKVMGFYTTCYDDYGPAANQQTPHYVVAWCGDEPKYPKKPKYIYPGVTEL